MGQRVLFSLSKKSTHALKTTINILSYFIYTLLEMQAKKTVTQLCFFICTEYR